jgi:hypothetical protein
MWMNHATLSLMPPNSVMSRDLHQGAAIVAAADLQGAATNRKCHDESPSRPRSRRRYPRRYCTGICRRERSSSSGLTHREGASPLAKPLQLMRFGQCSPWVELSILAARSRLMVQPVPHGMRVQPAELPIPVVCGSLALCYQYCSHDQHNHPKQHSRHQPGHGSLRAGSPACLHFRRYARGHRRFALSLSFRNTWRYPSIGTSNWVRQPRHLNGSKLPCAGNAASGCSSPAR